ncbi:hypothetical protein [Streptosporangium sp. NPDC051022]|uniref:hypothetical protein n=1 Tax=Streptosporangium sp. NPDC051022 TaxID=3155752 RepID=UPI00343F932F
MNRRRNLLHGLGWLLAATAFLAFPLLGLSLWYVPVVFCAWVGVMLVAQAALNVEE